jgi:hypothetical protein
METRAAGDKLQVAGNATFSDYITAKALNLTAGGKYLAFNANVSSSNTSALIQADTGMELHLAANKQGGQVKIHTSGNATFFGTVDAAGFTINGVPISGGGFSGNNLVIENSFAPEDQRKWRFNVNQQNGRLRIQALNDDDSLNISELIRFDRNGTISATSTVTATDFIATSDERVKDNITTVPVGLIDRLKGREWAWKESGKKGSGVVAQELEAVLPHLVHTDDEGMKSVAYNGLVAYLIEEVKALRAEIEALK